MDSPQEFVKDVIDADQNYSNGIDIKTLVGNFRVELVGFPKEAAIKIGEPITKPVFDIVAERLDEVVKRIKAVVDNPPECIDDEVTYQGIQYIATVEAPYSQSLIEHTFLKDHVVIPEGTDEFLFKLASIPRCNNGH